MIVAGSATTWLVGSRGTRPTYAPLLLPASLRLFEPGSSQRRFGNARQVRLDDVGEPRLERRQDFECPLGLVFRTASLRNRGCVCKGRVDDTDRREGKPPSVAFAIDAGGLRRDGDFHERGRPAADLTSAAFARVIIRGDLEHVISRLGELRGGRRLAPEGDVHAATRERVHRRVVLL